MDLPWPLALDNQQDLARLPAPAGRERDAAVAEDGVSETGVEAYGAPQVTQAAPAAITVGMQHLQLLVGLVWRAILMWGGLIALVGFTSWVS